MTRRPPLSAWLSPGLIGLHVLGLVSLVFCIGMGLWQAGVYDSRQEHEQADQQTVPRVALTDVWQPDEAFTGVLNHRPVRVEGEFAPASEQIWVTDKVQDGKTGVWLLAPFMVGGDGEALLVVRGWAPRAGDFPDVPTGSVTIDAVLEPGDGSGEPFDRVTRTIGSVRIPSILNETTYDLYAGFAISTDAASSGGLELVPPPVPGDVSWTVGVRNLAYALQWWVFGLFAAFMWWRMSTETIAAGRPKVA